MSVMLVQVVSAQDNVETTEVTSAAEIKLKIIPWRVSYFPSFEMEDLKNDSIRFFTGDKFRIKLGQARIYQNGGVVVIDSFDNVPSHTRLRFIKFGRSQTGRAVVLTQLPSGILISFPLVSDGCFIRNKGGDNESELMWYYAKKPEYFQEQTVEKTEQ